MTTLVRSMTAAAAAGVAILAGCGTTAPATGSPPRAAADAAALTATTAASVPGLATDQACTAHAASGATLRTTPYRTDDLAAMAVPRAALGAAVRHYQTDWLRYGYLDNVELPKIGIHPKGECALARSTGRITGFTRGFTGPVQSVGTQADLFFSVAGATSWVRGFAGGLKAAAGTQGIRSVTVTSVPSLGTGAVRVAARCTGGCAWTWVVFKRGGLVGTVVNQRDAGTRPVVDLTATARTLAGRMATRTAAVNARPVDPADAVMALSAGLPRSALSPRYAGLVWDWFYGGCWDPVEQEASTGDHAARVDAAAYGMLTFCRAMYVPAYGQSLNGVERAYTGGTLYRTAAGAHGQLAATVTRVLAKSNARPFAVPALGNEAVGLQEKGTPTVTRILFREGRYLATVTLVTGGISGMIGEVKRWAPMLDSRIRSLLASHRV